MIVPDTNLVLYAHVDGFAEHEAAREWWEGLMNGRTEVGIGAVYTITSPTRGCWNSGRTRSALCMARPSRFSIQS